MKAIIVAAGIGSRLGDLTKDLPKPLVEVNGKSILERQIEIFKKFGIDDIIIIRGPHKDKFNFEHVTYVEDTDVSNHDLLGSFMAAEKEMDDNLIISYGDIIFDENILSQIISSSENSTLAIDYDWQKKYHDNSNALLDKVSVVTLENNSIINIGYYENFKNFKNLVFGEFIGLMKISESTIIQLIEQYNHLQKNHQGRFHDSSSIHFGIITDMINELLKNEMKFSATKISGKWCEIDTLQDLEIAKKIFK
jgi:choline kinase